jgi:hypothetical protein
MRGPNFDGSNGAAGLMVATSKAGAAGTAGAADASCALTQAPAPNIVIAIADTAQLTLKTCFEAFLMKVPLCFNGRQSRKTRSGLSKSMEKIDCWMRHNYYSASDCRGRRSRTFHFPWAAGSCRISIEICS